VHDVGRGRFVGAGNWVTLVPAGWDQRLRNRPWGVLA